ncbi:Flp family type IVb pilin [Nocardioides sp. URHA0020]|uniref:Flp family type IVb pilin n=1 Tax=Nocardioides sp. URHA0020 TaxID=1380392 RepID=UPI000490E51E|nr:Flp family type IVb pilin [Nocardioides sp. URHA0020]
MLEHFRNLLQARRVDRDEAGASAVEYGLLVAGIAALIVAVIFLFGGMIKNTFSDTCTTIQSGQTSTAGHTSSACS